MKIPHHAYDLIDQLDELFPEVIYDPEGSREEFLLKQGERRLVLKLKALRASETADRGVRPRV